MKTFFGKGKKKEEKEEPKKDVNQFKVSSFLYRIPLLPYLFSVSRPVDRFIWVIDRLGQSIFLLSTNQSDTSIIEDRSHVQEERLVERGVAVEVEEIMD